MRINDRTIDILENLIIEDNTVKITEQLDRKTYKEVNNILESLFGKWDSYLKVHTFPDDVNIEQELELIIALGEYTDLKKDMQLFQTPKIYAETVAYYAQIQKTDFVIEPSVGLGAIADEVWDNTPNRPAKLWGIEINKQLERYLKHKPYQTFVGYDWLQVAQHPQLQNSVDKFVMNPPFSRNADIDHVMAAYRCLKPGGRLVSIMSRHWMFANDKKCVDFRELVNENGDIIQELEKGAFKESGTNIETVIISIDKP